MGFSDNPSPENRDTPNHRLHGALGFTQSIHKTVLLKELPLLELIWLHI